MATTENDDEPGPSAPGPSESGSHLKMMPTEDGEYYMEGWFITFEVERSLFRVPSYQFFKESPDFVDVYKLSLHGMDNSEPIKLEDVRQDDFRSLLKALYPLSVSLQLSMSKVEWISVLTLSSEWRFLRLREMAISELERLGSLSSVEKICLGRELHISSWVIAGFEELVRRNEPITDEEAIDVDSGYITTVYKLFRIRELRLAGRISSSNSRIKEIFKHELDNISRGERAFKLLDRKDEAIRLAKEEEERIMEEKMIREEERIELERMEQEAKKKEIRLEEERLRNEAEREEQERMRVDEERRSVLNAQLQESMARPVKQKQKGPINYRGNR